MLGTCDIWSLLCSGPGTHISDPGKFYRVRTLVWTIGDVRPGREVIEISNGTDYYYWIN